MKHKKFLILAIGAIAIAATVRIHKKAVRMDQFARRGPRFIDLSLEGENDLFFDDDFFVRNIFSAEDFLDEDDDNSYYL